MKKKIMVIGVSTCILLLLVAGVLIVMFSPLIKYDVVVFEQKNDLGTARLFLIGEKNSGEYRSHLEFTPINKKELNLLNENGEEIILNADEMSGLKLEAIIVTGNKILELVYPQERIFLERISVHNGFEQKTYKYNNKAETTFRYDKDDKFPDEFANPYIRLVVNGKNEENFVTDYQCSKIFAIPSRNTIDELFR